MPLNLKMFKPVLGVKKVTKEAGVLPETLLTVEEAEKLAEGNAFVRAFLDDDDVDEASVMSIATGFSYRFSKKFTPEFKAKHAHAMLDELLSRMEKESMGMSQALDAVQDIGEGFRFKSE
jgi:hypothetical protein